MALDASLQVAHAPVPVPGVINFTNLGHNESVERRGFAAPEPPGCWTNGADASLSFSIGGHAGKDVLLTLEMSAFVVPQKLTVQLVDISVNGVPCGTWTIDDGAWRERPLVLPAQLLGRSGEVTIGLSIPTCQSPASLGLGPDIRQLGVIIRRLVLAPIPHAVPEAERSSASIVLQTGRRVGNASRRTYDEKIRTGFWAKYLGGPRVLDIGCKGNDASGTPLDDGAGLPIIDGAIGVDLDYPGYDGHTLPFPTESQDAVYSSHSLEHILDYIKAIQEWHRVVKTGGHIIVVVPHSHLYERRRRPPSRWNLGHVRMYTSASLLAEFEAALAPNTFRVRHLLEDDRGYHYDDPPDLHARGGFEIEMVVQKISPATWQVAD